MTQTKSIQFSNIKWDTDGAKEPGLPESVELGVDQDCDVDVEGADVLSDKFGFCVHSFAWVALQTKSELPASLAYDGMTPEQQSAFDARQGITTQDRERIGQRG